MIVISNDEAWTTSQKFTSEEIYLILKNLPEGFNQGIKNRLLQVLSDDSTKR